MISQYNLLVVKAFEYLCLMALYISYIIKHYSVHRESGATVKPRLSGIHSSGNPVFQTSFLENENLNVIMNR